MHLRRNDCNRTPVSFGFSRKTVIGDASSGASKDENLAIPISLIDPRGRVAYLWNLKRPRPSGTNARAVPGNEFQTVFSGISVSTIIFVLAERSEVSKL
jgi:hypothetical protein